MRLKINPPVFPVVGASLLFVGLAGNASAIPDSISSWTSVNQQGDDNAFRSVGLNDRNEGPVDPTSFVVYGADLKENNGKPHDLIVHHFDRDNHGTPIGSSPSVPDGGTTAMMLGGSLCGLVLLAKKVKV